MFTITKDFTFSASHQLEGLPALHQCARLHGHNYVVRVELWSPTLDEVGFVKDFGELKPVAELLGSLDHQHLNDIFTFNPTAENMARWLATLAASELRWPTSQLAVGVSETPKTWSWWRP